MGTPVKSGLTSGEILYIGRKMAWYVEVHRPLSPEERRCGRLFICCPAEFTAFKRARGGSVTLVDGSAIPVKAGYPHCAAASRADATVNTTIVESAQNGFVGERGANALRRGSLYVADKTARCAPAYIDNVKLFEMRNTVVRRLVRASIVFNSPERRNACVYVITPVAQLWRSASVHRKTTDRF